MEASEDTFLIFMQSKMLDYAAVLGMHVSLCFSELVWTGLYETFRLWHIHVQLGALQTSAIEN